MEITKQQLQEKYENMTNDDLCKELGITMPTLIRYLEKNNIPLKGRGRKTSVRIV